jgi:hypothetical protein
LCTISFTEQAYYAFILRLVCATFPKSKNVKILDTNKFTAAGSASSKTDYFLTIS